jgi:hypothetical protein
MESSREFLGSLLRHGGLESRIESRLSVAAATKLDGVPIRSDGEQHAKETQPEMRLGGAILATPPGIVMSGAVPRASHLLGYAEGLAWGQCGWTCAMRLHFFSCGCNCEAKCTCVAWRRW